MTDGTLRSVELDQVIDGLLVSGLDDWVMLTQVESAVRRAATTETSDQIVDLTVDVVAAMLEGDLVVVGTVREPAGFEPWGTASAEAVTRIRSEWRGLGRPLEMGDICWVSNTALGDQRASNVRETRQDG